MSFSVVVSVGPGARESARLRDLLTSLALCEGESVRDVVLVDDGAALRLEDLASDACAGLPIRVVPSPRRGGGDPWRGGLTTNVLHGFAQCLLGPGVDFVLKLDTDSLILRPFARALAGRFATRPRAGLLGSSFRRSLFDLDVPPSEWRVNLLKWLAPVRFRRHPFPRVETAFWGRNRRIRALIQQALAHGWPLGHCAQGGGYALRADLVRCWRKDGWLDDAIFWRHTDLGEDIVSALLCFAAGFEIEDYNARGEPFGVQFQGLAFSPAECLERGYAIVHSVKAADPQVEERLRAQFRAPLAALR